MGLFDKLFGTRSQRELKKIQPIVDKILALEEEYKNLSEEQLKAKTPEFKERLAQGETLDDILPEAFAAIREAADRVLGMRPYPVQLIGGIVLHQGRIAEMRTGEGKTLVAILPTYLNALTGLGVHVVTVNDYLAKYQSEWMGKVYRYMGLTIGLVILGMTPAERRTAYAADITYCTNNELGFDYLRDNMAIYKQELVQRGHNFAIVDEVDSILIDEARTPLIISGQGEKSTQLYTIVDQFVSRLKCQRVRTVEFVVYTYFLRSGSLSSDMRSEAHAREVFKLLEVYGPVLKNLELRFADSRRISALYHMDFVGRYVCRLLGIFATRRTELLSEENIVVLYKYMSAVPDLDVFSLRLGQIPNILLYKVGRPHLTCRIYSFCSSLLHRHSSSSV